MKFKYSALLIILFWSISLFAQQNEIELALNPLPGTQSDWEFQLSLDFKISPANGLVIELPDEIKLIPVSIKINGAEVWLQNIITVPERDSVIAWQTVSEGIILLYKKKLVQSGDMFTMKCMATINELPLKQARVRIKEVVWQSDNLKISDQAFATGTIPRIPKR